MGFLADIKKKSKKKPTARSVAELDKIMKLMDVLDMMIYVTDLEYNVLYVNKKLLDTYGIENIDGANAGKCYNFLHGLERSCPHCAFPKLLKQDAKAYHEQGLFYEYESVFDERLQKWQSGKTGLIEWADDYWVQIHCCQDETAKHEALEKQKEAEAKASELARQTEEAFLSKSTFIANTSHEIRTPMNAILGFSELALDDLEISVKTRDYLTKIVKNAHTLSMVINNILEVSRIESNNVEVEENVFEISDVIEECRSFLSPEAESKQLQFHLYAENDVKVRGDYAKLIKVLVSILSNSIKFTSFGIVRLAINIKHESYDNCTLTFEIQDSGIGMSSEQITKIFEPFNQADSSTTRKYGGIGLGLTVAKHLIDVMGGSLKVESALQLGSKFQFDLNFAKVQDEITAEPSFQNTANLARPAFAGGLVLVCEDNEMNQNVVCEHLSRVGLDTIVAQNGQEAVDMVQERLTKDENNFDLIFMDIHMPVMDGLQAARNIKDIAPSIPIVAMTANIMTTAQPEFKESGMEGCVNKPFTPQELWKCLLQYFATKDDPQNALPADGFETKMLSYFVNKNQTTYDDFVRAFESGDKVLAHRIVHNLKSNAGYIKEPVLQQISSNIENYVKEERPITASQLSAFKQELEIVLDKLAPLLDKDDDIADNRIIDPEAIQYLLIQLTPLLENGNATALDYLDTVRTIPGSKPFVEKLENFEFYDALKELNKLKKLSDAQHFSVM